MSTRDAVTPHLHGMYRDVLRDAAGGVRWDSGWRSNAIVGDCRRLLAGFMRNAPASLGVQGLAVGAGLDTWDGPPGAPPASAAQTTLVDPDPWTVALSDLQIDFILDDGSVAATPTNRLQILASLGPGVPDWPDPTHPTSTLREFGLVGELDGSPLLINYVTHAAIVKDPASTLDRTIWLVF